MPGEEEKEKMVPQAEVEAFVAGASLTLILVGLIWIFTIPHRWEVSGIRADLQQCLAGSGVSTTSNESSLFGVYEGLYTTCSTERSELRAEASRLRQEACEKGVYLSYK